MNRVEPQPVPQGDLDALLGAFFKAQVPAPWPAFRAPAKTRLLPPWSEPDSRARPAWGSRLALAAAVALLLAGAWLWPRPPATSGGGPGAFSTLPGSGTAGKGGQVLPAGPSVKPGQLTPDKVKSSLHLEQGNDGATNIKITVEELPSKK
jgi:hypothetical protein